MVHLNLLYFINPTPPRKHRVKKTGLHSTSNLHRPTKISNHRSFLCACMGKKKGALIPLHPCSSCCHGNSKFRLLKMMGNKKKKKGVCAPSVGTCALICHFSQSVRGGKRGEKEKRERKMDKRNFSGGGNWGEKRGKRWMWLEEEEGLQSAAVFT